MKRSVAQQIVVLAILLQFFTLAISPEAHANASETHLDKTSQDTPKANSPDTQTFKTHIEHHLVNGFDVYLIDNKYGNEFTLAVTVATGSLNDDPVRHAGRAHLWEHVIHNGTAKFPGSTAFNEITDKYKINTNAYTSDTLTYYFMTGLASVFDPVVELQGSMFSEPEWNEDSFRKEKANVMDEAKKYESHSGFILENATFMNLLPEGHPWRMYSIGTQEQLTHMTLEDLRELYFVNYQPGSMKIIVTGNFTSTANGVAPLNKDHVLQQITKYYLPPQKPKELQETPSYNKTVFPELNPHGVPQILELGSPQPAEYTANIKFPIDPAFAEKNFFALETLNDYLNMEGEGSVAHLLKSRGLVSSLSFSFTKNNNLWLEEIHIQYTPQGAQKRYDVVAQILAYIQRLEQDGMNTAAFRYLTKRNVLSYANSTKSTQALSKYVGDRLHELYRGNSTDMLNYELNYGTVTHTAVHTALTQIFNPTDAIMGYIGSDVKSEQKAPVFKVPMIKINAQNDIAPLWQTARQIGCADITSAQVQMHPLEIPLQFSPPRELPSRPPRFVPTGRKGIAAVLEENHDLNEGAIRVVYLNGPESQTVDHKAALRLITSAFFERYAKEIDFFQTMGTFTGDVFSVKGNSQASLQTLKWLLHQYFNFEPTAEEIQRAQGRLLASLAREANNFPAKTAASTALEDLKHQFSTEQIIKAADHLDTTSAFHLFRESLKQGNLLLSAYGDYTSQEVREIARLLSQLTPFHLSEQDLHKRYATDKLIATTRRYLAPLTENQSEFGFGVARVYQAPEPVINREAIAFSVLATVLKSEVFNLNRTERSLGYVHSASLSPSLRHSYFVFLGQADGENETEARAKLALTQKGWEELMAKVKNRTLSPDQFQNAISAEILEHQKMATNLIENAVTLSQTVQHYFNPYTSARPDPLVQEKYMAILKSLTADEIYTAGGKYLLDKPYFEVFQTRNFKNCADLLQ